MLNVLRWTVDGVDRRRSSPPSDVQPFPAFLGHAVPVVSPAELQGIAFTEAHLRGSRPVGWRAASAIAVEVRQQLAAGERFVYAYYGGVDKTAHERGFGEFYDAELRFADRLVADVLEVLPPGAVLLVTADHGQVQVGDRIVVPDPRPAGDGRPAVGRGSVPLVARHARAPPTTCSRRPPSATRTSPGWSARQQTIDEHWFGPTCRRADGRPARRRRARAVRRRSASMTRPTPDRSASICRHGSLTPAEVFVPLLAGNVMRATAKGTP